MAQAQLATLIDSSLKKAVSHYCKAMGLKISKFVESALLEKLETLEDISELKSLRKEPARPLAEVIKELKKNGKI